MTSKAARKVQGATVNPMISGSRSRGHRQQGVTYLIALFLVAAIGAGLALTGMIWSQASQREKEAELIWIGNQFTQAIGLYYHRTPGTIKRYPENLEDLLHDRRFQTTQRYLRKIYVDPMTKKASWGIVAAPGGGIMGVHSLSSAATIKQVGTARSYSEWAFTYTPPAPVSGR